MMQKITLFLFLAASLLLPAGLHAQSPAWTLKANLLGIPGGDVILEADYQAFPNWSFAFGVGTRNARAQLDNYSFFSQRNECGNLGVGVFLGGRFLVTPDQRGVLAIKPLISYHQYSFDPNECIAVFPQGYTFFDRTVWLDLMASYSYQLTDQFVLEAAIGFGAGFVRDSRLIYGWQSSSVTIPAQLSLGYMFGK